MNAKFLLIFQRECVGQKHDGTGRRRETAIISPLLRRKHHVFGNIRRRSQQRLRMDKCVVIVPGRHCGILSPFDKIGVIHLRSQCTRNNVRQHP